MGTVTLSQKEYEALKQKASLYENLFQASPERVFGTEPYSERQIKEIFKGDHLSPKLVLQLKRLLKSS